VLGRVPLLIVLQGVTLGLLLGPAAGPAAAHGAPTDPASRAAECGPDGRYRSSAPCAAAIRAGGTGRLDWDDLRVPDVAGRDRQLIPDGRLCSGGLPRFAGLDAPGSNWPTTPLVAGADFTLSYRTTIPHQGTFRVYLTRTGYDPARPLRWADLDARPFLTSTDPAVTDGAYLLHGRLPADRTGRHLIYTIWQNSSTPDTYYSCSDVMLSAAENSPSAQNPAPTEQPAPAGAASPGSAQDGSAQDGSAPELSPVAAAIGPDGVPAVAMVVGVGGSVLIGGLLLRFRRRRS